MKFCSDKWKLILGATCHSKRFKFSLKWDSRQAFTEIIWICTHIQQYKLRRDEDINKHWNIFVVVRNLMWCTCFIFWETYSSVLKNWYATVLFYQEPYYSVFCLPLSHQSPMSALSGILVSNFLFQNLKSILILN